MSHVAEMEIDILDLDALATAVRRLGLEFVPNQVTYKWYGTHVGDYPVPKGFEPKDLGHCLHAIRIPGDERAYEIGVVKRRDGKPGYQLMWDFWKEGFGLMEKIGSTGGLLKQAYGVQVAKKQMLRDGYRVTEVKDAKGNILLNFQE